MKKLKIVLVEWIDSESNNEWQFFKDLSQELASSHASGFLVQDNKEFIRLSTSIDYSTESCIGTLLIPKKCILKIKILSTFLKGESQRVPKDAHSK